MLIFLAQLSLKDFSTEKKSNVVYSPYSPETKVPILSLVKVVEATNVVIWRNARGKKGAQSTIKWMLTELNINRVEFSRIQNGSKSRIWERALRCGSHVEPKYAVRRPRRP